MDEYAKYYVKELQGLVGGRILQTIYDENEGFFGIIVGLPDGTKKVMWILSDEEGNGPGAVQVDEAKIKGDKDEG